MNHSVDNLSITSLSMSPSTYSNSTILSPSYSSVHIFNDSLLSDSMEYVNQKNTNSDRKSKKSKHKLSLSIDSTSNDDSLCTISPQSTRSKKGETKSKSKSKSKTKTKTKRKSKNKHKKSHKKSAENNSNNNINIIHDRKILRIDDDIDSEIRISYIVSRSSFRISINFGIENKCNGILKNIRLKWYTINNKQQNILLSKVIKSYEYDSRIHHLYFDVDGYKYDNNILICKLKYTFIGLDSWEELEKIPKKSEKFKLKL